MAQPNVGPSGRAYHLGWRVEEMTQVHLLLDGAEEDMPVVIEGPDRFRSGDRYFVRRR